MGNYRYDCDFAGNATPVIEQHSAYRGLYYYNFRARVRQIVVALLWHPYRGDSRSAGSQPCIAVRADNNGVILELAVTTGVGGGTASGSLVFGIGTQANNGLGSATVLTLDANLNDPAWTGFTTTFNNVAYPNSQRPTLTFKFILHRQLPRQRLERHLLPGQADFGDSDCSVKLIFTARVHHQRLRHPTRRPAARSDQVPFSVSAADNCS